MDRSATPWRVLDEAGSGAPGLTASGAEAPSPSAGLPRLSWPTIGGFLLAAALAIGAFAIAASSSRGEISVEGGSTWTASGSPQETGEQATGGSRLVVDVQGAVLRPGILELDPGSRVADAIAAAGGFGPRVDAERAGRELNLAQAVKDGDRVVVPSRDDPAGTAQSGPADSGDAAGGGQPGGLVDLNSATAEELDKLPGIGPVTAQKIIDARAEKPFATVDELRDRKVLGSATFEKLRDLVTVR
jgi:competence protein ComEA